MDVDSYINASTKKIKIKGYKRWKANGKNYLIHADETYIYGDDGISSVDLKIGINKESDNFHNYNNFDSGCVD